MSLKEKQEAAAQLLVQKLGLSIADARRRSDSLVDEAECQEVLNLGQLPQAGNFLTTYFDLLSMEAEIDGKTKTFVAARAAFEQSVSAALPAKPPVAEAATAVSAPVPKAAKQK